MKLLRTKIKALPESLKLLKTVELFEDLEARELRVLEPIVHERHYVPGRLFSSRARRDWGCISYSMGA
jgi:hypothetical protein